VLTFRENRVNFVESGRPVYPSRVTVRLDFEPSPFLGDSVEGATVLEGSMARFSWNANTGRATVLSEPPFPSAKSRVLLGDTQVALDDHTLEVVVDCASSQELTGHFASLCFIMPLAFAIEFREAVVARTTTASSPSANYVWQVARSSPSCEIISVETRDDRINAAILNFSTLLDAKNTRLLCAAEYFHKAVRMIEVGAGPSEFAAESIVNLSKVLEVLFPGEPTRQVIRAGLNSAGVEAGTIERYFLPCVMLRSHFDAAHVKIEGPTPEQRQTLQQYLESAVHEFRIFLSDYTHRVSRDEIAVAEYQPDPSDQEVANFFKRLSESFAANDVG